MHFLQLNAALNIQSVHLYHVICHDNLRKCTLILFYLLLYLKFHVFIMEQVQLKLKYAYGDQHFSIFYRKKKQK